MLHCQLASPVIPNRKVDAVAAARTGVANGIGGVGASGGSLDSCFPRSHTAP
jgi:hypothetical protein